MCCDGDACSAVCMCIVRGGVWCVGVCGVCGVVCCVVMCDVGAGVGVGVQCVVCVLCVV